MKNVNNNKHRIWVFLMVLCVCSAAGKEQAKSDLTIVGRLVFLYGDDSPFPLVSLSITNLGETTINIPLKKMVKADDYFTVVNLDSGEPTAIAPGHFPIVEEPPEGFGIVSLPPKAHISLVLNPPSSIIFLKPIDGRYQLIHKDFGIIVPKFEITRIERKISINN